MAQSQEEKVRKNSAWKKTAAGKKSQKKVMEATKQRRNRGIYGKGGGDMSHPRKGKKGWTIESAASNRGNSEEKKMIAARNKKGYNAKYA